MDHLNRKIATAIIIVCVAVAVFAYLMIAFPPDGGGLGALIQSPSEN